VGEALRADFQKHLEMVQREMPFQFIRMHGLFHEDMMVYREEKGEPVVTGNMSIWSMTIGYPSASGHLWN